jgi:hypothetical protein
MVSCGKTENGETSGNTISSPKTTTSAAATTAESGDSKDEKTTTAAKAADNSKDTAKADTSAKDSEQTTMVLNEEDRLFGAYVDTQGDGLNLRNEPFPTADIIATIPDKTQIDIYSCGKAGWYCTSYNGKSGYVSADYIKKIQDYEPQENTQELITDISELVGQWKYQIAPEGKNITAGATDNGTIDIKSDGTYIYTDLDGNTHSGTVKVDYDTLGGDYRVPFFAFYEGDQFFIGCYCHESHSDVYMTGNGGMSQIVRIK